MPLSVVLQETIQDTWRWLLDPIHGYSVHGAYHFITTSGAVVDKHLVDDVWHKTIPSKVSFFVWVIQPTDTGCIAAFDNSETAKHLFLGCDIYSSLWSLVLHWLGISSVFADELRHHFLQFIHMAVIWKERNNRVFNNAASIPFVLLEKVKIKSFLWLKYQLAYFCQQEYEMIWWEKPARGWYKCNIDASFSSYMNKVGIGMCFHVDVG
ncbi:hypothetical protein MTR_6g084160 [Medicago truncatula]|uniref:Reverse transcriptase zinc-binding domain-containing protein n=1 Tax=Medicago truncatula TaxID=3880 RepID=G7KN16_MEDTR|nr:hypothetical protein MTR_6g084160 [Medicago truncatula]